MESFFRYVSYVDYYRNGERIKNVGFLRWKLYNSRHQIELQVKDVPCVRGSYEVIEKNTKKIIGDVVIDKGIGFLKTEFQAMETSGEEYINLLRDRLYLKDVKGVLIKLDSNEYLSVSLKLIQEDGEDEHPAVTKAASENVLIDGIKEKYEEPVLITEKELEIDEDKIGKVQITDKKMEILEPIHEDKWQQLCKKYPNVHPFSNDKVFLTIKPEDFIILQQKYQALVHNSFLLHGFYNYGHMILGKLSEEKETPIYVGVPGVYYEQEKRAAQIFGFVGFESAKQPIQTGSYGYYMIEVEI